jgi:2-polyprenyl-6-methoxyphenol hydroxylase-like FAD-dependent oxidoreductase
LATAIALQRVGIDVAVFERTSEFREAGAGLGVQGNAIRAMQRLGVADHLLKICPVLEWQEIYSHKGTLLARLPVGEVTREYGTPTVAAHRADLQAALLGGVDRQAIRMNATCVGFEQDAEGVTARFADGREERGAVLVGADGIHSAVRQQLRPGEKPLYQGHIVWRGVLVPGREMFPPSTFRMFVGRGAFFVIFNVGLGRVYWAGMKLLPQGSKDEPCGRKQEVLNHHRGFPEPVEALIEGTEESAILRHDVFDREPDTWWGKGRVTLLGDAAHLTTPHVGQGYGISVEDGIVLAKDLALTQGLRDKNTIEMALRSYEKKRMPRTGSIVLESRRIGNLYKMMNPVQCLIRNTILWLTPAKTLRQRIVHSLGEEI